MFNKFWFLKFLQDNTGIFNDIHFSVFDIIYNITNLNLPKLERVIFNFESFKSMYKGFHKPLWLSSEKLKLATH